MNLTELEVCVDTAASLSSCLQAELDRIELCSALAVGGLTPAYGFMKLAGKLIGATSSANPQMTASAVGLERVRPALTRPIMMAMIRPRCGNFCFSRIEADSMCDDIVAARDAGLDGVVLGAATTDGVLDLPVLQRLCATAHGLQLTLHRVIDLLDDPLLAIDQAVDLGFERILTSGGAVTVSGGLLQLAEMHKHAGSRIQIMAGAGLSPALASLIRAETGITAFHSSCRRTAPEDPVLSAFGFGGQEGELDSSLVDEFRRSLAAARA